MPTTPAGDTAAAESSSWAAIAAAWSRELHQELWSDLPPVEGCVIPEVDPQEDLSRRARRWGYALTDADLPDLAIFAAALAAAEADAWRSGDGVLATQAYEERRFLAADRIAPWAVPWLISAGRCFPESRAAATDAVTRLLEIGERHRWAPALAGHEGLLPPGHDGYGPAAEPRGLALRMHSLWGGGVLFGRSILALSGGRTASRRPERRLLGAPGFRGDVHTWYEVAAVRWERLAGRQPGSTRNWLDLAVRARLTAEIAK